MQWSTGFLQLPPVLTPMWLLRTVQNFESGVFNVQHGNSATLPSDERPALAILETYHNNINEWCEYLSFAEKVLKTKALKYVWQVSGYMDVRFLGPTSNICEILFSVAGFMLDERRRAILQVNFKSRGFLNPNSDLWNHIDISKVVN